MPFTGRRHGGFVFDLGDREKACTEGRQSFSIL